MRSKSRCEERARSDMIFPKHWDVLALSSEGQTTEKIRPGFLSSRSKNNCW